MARRPPLHLRWIYVKNHAGLFVAIGMGGAVATGVAVFLVGDPARGLLLGAVPAFCAALVWLVTNNATYVERAPANGLAPTPDTPPAPHFERVDGEAQPAGQPSPASMSGDPFAGIPDLVEAGGLKRRRRRRRRLRRKQPISAASPQPDMAD